VNVFKFHEAVVDSIAVETTDDGAEIRFDGNTLGFNPSSDNGGLDLTRSLYCIISREKILVTENQDLETCPEASLLLKCTGTSGQ